jgi:hypothetical protein
MPHQQVGFICGQDGRSGHLATAAAAAAAAAADNILW